MSVEQGADPMFGQSEQLVELSPFERAVLSRALNLDEAASVHHDHVHVRLRTRVLCVVEIKDAASTVDAHGYRRHESDEGGWRDLRQGVGERDAGTCDGRGAGAAIGLQDIAVDLHGAFAETLGVDGGPERTTNQSLDLNASAALFAARCFTVRARVGGCGKHAVFRGHPTPAPPAQERRNPGFDTRGANHLRVAELDKDRARGMLREIPAENHRSELVRRTTTRAVYIHGVGASWVPWADYNGSMVASMTAFGRAEGDLVDWEVRSVNHRYLEISFRMPEPFRDLEPELRELVASRVQRGKIDATLRFAGQASILPRLNQGALDGLLAVVEDIRRRGASVGAVDPMQVLRFPGVVQDDEDNLAHFKTAARRSFGTAVENLLDHRNTEGAKLAGLLRERLALLEQAATSIREFSAGQGSMLRERLRRRAHELIEQLDEHRLEQEVALLVQKADVTEELDRLDIHAAETRASLDADGPCGRRLDFLLQEMNREANTLAAKSVLPHAAHVAVDLKVTIEQMREQAQNVE